MHRIKFGWTAWGETSVVLCGEWIHIRLKDKTAVKPAVTCRSDFGFFGGRMEVIMSVVESIMLSWMCGVTK